MSDKKVKISVVDVSTKNWNAILYRHAGFVEISPVRQLGKERSYRHVAIREKLSKLRAVRSWMEGDSPNLVVGKRLVAQRTRHRGICHISLYSKETLMAMPAKELNEILKQI